MKDHDRPSMRPQRLAAILRPRKTPARIVAALFGIAASLGVAQAEIVDLTALVRQQSVVVVVTGSVSHADFPPRKAFDGDLTTNGRWLGTKPFPTPPAYFDCHLPADWEPGKFIVLRSYTVVRLPVGTA